MPILGHNPERGLVTLVGRPVFSQLLTYASSHGLTSLNKATITGRPTAQQDFQIKIGNWHLVQLTFRTFAVVPM